MFDTIFAIANVYPLPFWALMIFAPNWSWTRRLMTLFWVFVPLAVGYTVLLFISVAGLSGGAPLDFTMMSNLRGVMQLLSTPEGATAGWLHYLCFDLFVGRWIYLDGTERGVNPLLRGIALFFTLLSGPFGLLLYLLFRRSGR
jgi:hypothetical protein